MAFRISLDAMAQDAQSIGHCIPDKLLLIAPQQQELFYLSYFCHLKTSALLTFFMVALSEKGRWSEA
jgi:hypothetical protein